MVLTISINWPTLSTTFQLRPLCSRLSTVQGDEPRVSRVARARPDQSQKFSKRESDETTPATADSGLGRSPDRGLQGVRQRNLVGFTCLDQISARRRKSPQISPHHSQEARPEILVVQRAGDTRMDGIGVGHLLDFDDDGQTRLSASMASMSAKHSKADMWEPAGNVAEGHAGHCLTQPPLGLSAPAFPDSPSRRASRTAAGLVQRQLRYPGRERQRRTADESARRPQAICGTCQHSAPACPRG